MIPAITLDEAEGRTWDVVIAGSSFAAMYFLLGLPRDLSVLILERGPIQTHAEQLAAGRITGLEPFDRRAEEGDPEKVFTAHTVFGGNSNCWTGNIPRFVESDFAMKSTYGVGEDWPLTYDDLEPFYVEVEAAMEATDGGDPGLSPRSAPCPYPAHIPSRTDAVLRDRSTGWCPLPTARSNGGSRTPCCTTGHCGLCPADAKYTILNDIDRFARPGVFLATGAEVRAVRREGGKARGLVVRDAEGAREISAGHVALGTNAIFNAAILLRSGFDSPALGRYLNEQLGRWVTADGPGFGYFGGTSITGLGYALYDGPHRASHAGALVEVINAPPYLRPEIGKWTQRAFLKIVCDDLPQARNRVTLDGDEEPVIEFHGHSDYTHRGMAAALAALPDLLPDIEAFEPQDYAPTEAHIQGTHRMGTDPETSVTDGFLRMHGTSGLSVLGAGAFPTTTPANPTLTLAALSLRSGRALA